MTPSPFSSEPQQRRLRIAEILETVARLRLAGEHLSDAAIVALHGELQPELAEELLELSRVERARRMAVGLHGPPHAHGSDGDQGGIRPTGSADAFPGYEILGDVARGAQGTVYRAVQRATGRQVAIKQLHEYSLAGARARLRFEREVQILAQIEHPNVVTIHDSSSAGGRFYYVMDYIEGMPLDQWVSATPSPVLDLRSTDKDAERVSRRRTPTGNRKSEIDDHLRLFAKICDALHAAHLRGVIHRDLKPSNIRIDARGEPHVLDFGLAKVASGVEPSDDAASRPATAVLVPRDLTLTGQFVGSLPWSSPEQVQGDADRVDLRSDVYSLGLILYYMLTGGYPYDVTGNVRDVVDNILRAAPVRPSTIRRRIDDELETIVLKALSKDRERRYQAAGDLARDVRCYLAGDAIEAKRDSTWYVVKKVAFKHRTAVCVGAAFTVIVAASTVALAVMYRQQVELRLQAETQAELVQKEHKRSETEARKAVRTSEFLSNLLLAATPEEAKGDQVTVATVLDHASRTIEQELAEQPEVEAAVQATIGRSFQRLGRYPDAERHLLRSLELHRATLGDTHRETLRVMYDLSVMRCEQNRLDEAETMAREALAGYDRLGPDEERHRLDVVNVLAMVHQGRGDYAAAERLHREALTRRRALLGDTHEDTLNSLLNLGLVLLETGRPSNAEPLLRQALEELRDTFGEDHPRTLNAINNLAGALNKLGKTSEAEALYRRGVELSRRIRGDAHPSTLVAINNLALVLARQKRLDEAEPLYREVIEARRRVLPEGHPDTLISIVSLSRLLVDRGAADQAEPMLREALITAEKALPPGHTYLGVFRGNLGTCLQALGRLDEAETELLASYEMLNTALGPAHEYTRKACQALQRLYEAWSKPTEAQAWQTRFEAASHAPPSTRP